MAGADAAGRRGGGLAVVWPVLLALLVAGGCSALSAHDETADSLPSPGGVALPPPPPTAGTSASAPAVSRAAQTATRIERVTIDSAPPTTRVVLQLDGTAEPEVSLLANQRLVIDVPGTTCASLPRVLEAAGDPLVERVRTGQHGPPENKSRIVVDLRTRADFSVRTQGERIVAYLAPADAASGAAPPSAADASRVLFGAEGAAVIARPADVTAPPAAVPSAGERVAANAASPAATALPTLVAAAEPTPSPPTIAPVSVATETVPWPEATPASSEGSAPSRASDTRPGAADPTAAASPAPVLGAAAPGATPPDAEPVPNLEIPAAESARASADARAAAPPADRTASPEEGAERPAAPSPPSDVPPATAASNEGSLPALPVPEATPQAQESSSPAVAATRTTSKRISIDFTEADVRTVIELIAAAGGYHVLFTPDVGGTITISLVDRPWEDALVTVLRAKRLREVRHEDVMLVSPIGR